MGRSDTKKIFILHQEYTCHPSLPASLHYVFPGGHQPHGFQYYVHLPTQTFPKCSGLSFVNTFNNRFSFVSSLKNKIVQVPVTRKPVTVHVPQNVPVNFVPVHVPTQDLGPLSVVELDPFGNKTLSVTYLDFD